jgi:hypothetical protein
MCATHARTHSFSRFWNSSNVGSNNDSRFDGGRCAPETRSDYDDSSPVSVGRSGRTPSSVPRSISARTDTKGTTGRPLQLMSNYFKMHVDLPEVFQYDVKYEVRANSSTLHLQKFLKTRDRFTNCDWMRIWHFAFIFAHCHVLCSLILRAVRFALACWTITKLC